MSAPQAEYRSVYGPAVYSTTSTVWPCPGQKLFLNDVRVTQAKGFGHFNVAAKWKRRYHGFAPDEAWFILTNFCDLNSAIVSYQNASVSKKCSATSNREAIASKALKRWKSVWLRLSF
ncbi:hypothetical protein [Acaryochloris sp. CCMEE 5410]|uniref:hypothetical protein n=1 Tax=Acaryochloris sp. CCMEE 5410 TaxID=310037 RepID=UPI0021CEBA80|nr:hypothetical protein [Acaryochloris sp. CCMEE 5410]